MAAKKKHAKRRKRSTKSAKGDKRRRHTPAERAKILATARREGLTGAQVEDRFGISQVTYYLWRKKSGAKGRRRKRAAATGAAVGRTIAGAMNLADVIRHELRAHIGRVLPAILESEIGTALSRTARRGRRRG